MVNFSGPCSNTTVIEFPFEADCCDWFNVYEYCIHCVHKKLMWHSLGGGANQSEFRLVHPFWFHETKRGEPVGICLFLKSGWTSRKITCFWKSGRTSRKIFRIGLSRPFCQTQFYGKMRRAGRKRGAPRPAKVFWKKCTRKKRKAEHGTCEVFRFFRVLRPKTTELTVKMKWKKYFEKPKCSWTKIKDLR